MLGIYLTKCVKYWNAEYSETGNKSIYLSASTMLKTLKINYV